MKTLYVSDLDGTLLNHSEQISDYSLKILNHLIENGLSFTYATARSLSSASKVTKGLNLKLPVIVYNGGMIREAATGQLITMERFTTQEQQEVQALCCIRQLSPLVYSFLNSEEKVSWIMGSENEGMLHYLSLRQGDQRLRPLASEDTLYDGDIFYYTCIGDFQELYPVFEYFKTRPNFRCTLQQELYREEYWCEIMPANATKAAAILKLKTRYGFEEIVSFGDAINDLPMFEISDRCYAVKTAVPELQAAADGIIGGNDEDGVVHWLKHSTSIESLFDTTP